MSDQQIAKKPQTINRIWKDKRSFTHDLFKLLPAMMKKNLSYKRLDPKLEDSEHSHFFHSHSIEGLQLDKSTPIGGHFHKITIKVVNGKMEAECSEPLRIVEKMLSSGGTIKLEEPVQWVSERMGKTIVDTHTHDVQYLYSEEMSQEKVKAIQNQNADVISRL